jgi:hypothetical protein
MMVNPELAQIQNICRDRATLIMDEFYCVSHLSSPPLYSHITLEVP